MKQSDELIKIALQGLRYLQTYAWLFLRTLVTAGYLGWMAFAFTTAVDVYVLGGKIDVQRPPGLIITFASILVGLYSLLIFQASPITYYAYAFFPVLFWEEVFARSRALAEGKNQLFSQFSKSDTVKFALNIAAYLALLEVMVSTRVPTINCLLMSFTGPKLLQSTGLYDCLPGRYRLATALRYRLRQDKLFPLHYMGTFLRCYECLHSSTS
jgi:hypothetical protein